MHVPAASPFFNRTYNEAFNLLVEARNYMAYAERRERGQLGLIGRLELACEAMRVTARLTQIMAWLLMQRAVYNGEMTLEEACSEANRLSGDGVCLDNTPLTHEIMPAGIRSLLDRTHQLYLRVWRMDEMVRNQFLH